jgi:hypothetical protein
VRKAALTPGEEPALGSLASLTAGAAARRGPAASARVAWNQAGTQGMGAGPIPGGRVQGIVGAVPALFARRQDRGDVRRRC